jgi:hypothetical protein
MKGFENIKQQIEKYEILQNKGILPEYNLGKLNGMLEVMDIVKNLDLASINNSVCQTCGGKGWYKEHSIPTKCLDCNSDEQTEC